VIRVAAIGDTHYAEDTRGLFRPIWERLAEDADVLLLAGDLTNLGNPAQARGFAEELRGLDVPVVAVLGNHDYHAGTPGEVRRAIEAAGGVVLEGESVTLRVNGSQLGVAGAKGFGGGFVGACGHAFGEQEMKQFIRVTEAAATRLHDAVASLHDADHRIALLHYSPVKDTLAGERLEIYPFLGSFQLAEALDTAGADLVVHGHAHHGAEKGLTPRGIPVRNAAMPLVKRPYVVYDLERRARPADDPAAVAR